MHRAGINGGELFVWIEWIKSLSKVFCFLAGHHGDIKGFLGENMFAQERGGLKVGFADIARACNCKFKSV